MLLEMHRKLKKVSSVISGGVIFCDLDFESIQVSLNQSKELDFRNFSAAYHFQKRKLDQKI